MPRRTLPFALLLAGALADAAGGQAAAFYLLFVAVPMAAAVSLACWGELVDARVACREEGFRLAQAALCGLALALIVGAAAAHAPALHGGAVPRLGVTALVAALVLFAASGGLSLSHRLRRRYVVRLRAVQSPARMA